MKIKDSVVVITGGAKGLGKSMARIFSSKGAHVVICDKNIDELDSISKDLGVTGIPADVTSGADLSEVLKKVILQFDHVDIWVNNAGVWMPPVALEDVDMEKAKKLFEINVFGTIHGMRIASK
jgi:NAD(P)-dependent dehydrogenase (short-subunit alcohol dehydrogenase family)